MHARLKHKLSQKRQLSQIRMAKVKIKIHKLIAIHQNQIL